MSIHVLDENTINQIAAGEVIERPSSVVKELAENAVDAGATAITIEIRDGGISYIRVSDNGSGIAKEDIRLAFVAHATSKIRDAEDLIGVTSLGFRGEALSSIAAVAQVEVSTRQRDSQAGYTYKIEGGKEKELTEAGVPAGTTFIIRNLFFNTPVRRRFLKSAAAEGAYVGALIERMAMSHPDIAFRFVNGGRLKLSTSGSNNLKDIIYSIYGRDVAANLLPVHARTQGAELTGFIGKPSVSRGSRSAENYFVNGRFIKSASITKGIEEAYKGYIMLHSFPFTALMLTMNATMTDVNVHPQKRELRFTNEGLVYSFVLQGVRAALDGHDLIPEIAPGSTAADESSSLRQSGEGTEEKEETARIQKDDVPEFPLFSGQVADNHSHYGASFLERQDSLPKPEIVPESTMQTGQNTEAEAPETANKPEELKELKEEKREEQKEEAYRAAGAFLEEQEKKERSAALAEKKEKAAAAVPEQMELDTETEKQIPYRLVGQFFGTYWLIEHGDEVFFMDQHAAHEKVMFERFMRRYRARKIDSQMILPVVIETDAAQEMTLKENIDSFKALGYEIEEFGEGTYRLTGIPAGLPPLDYRALFLDLLDNLGSGGGTDLITEKIASMSCKAAVKGNTRLSFQEADALVQELRKAENPYNCPHGRPTLIRMTKYEFDRKFRRIV
ncbi:MAG: DNA mismatch repair endonuclease MutL [Lachnospiraceae bacterium]|jgi:DNA mismatch repair protein MutL|nr:DNA mismatch repair endonuclease MutL [Lachnospiraceae bacterium]MCH4030457.1 DNA mismatch repair endonuclease MutL [Lachnospiraceae bacterium]MCH4069667.1 DNA mismatch repair endonuclease MutL [Lachnospiraceae bacterium]MCH4107395.1 DNA mismatch repair endonuclease MutL [Lachnospiraceae bacterium]MCI1301751.1 DNA mismatch repair endonuclease MutL [Lachnospiraceae bacterium]